MSQCSSKGVYVAKLMGLCSILVYRLKKLILAFGSCTMHKVHRFDAGARTLIGCISCPDSLTTAVSIFIDDCVRELRIRRLIQYASQHIKYILGLYRTRINMGAGSHIEYGSKITHNILHEYWLNSSKRKTHFTF